MRRPSFATAVNGDGTGALTWSAGGAFVVALVFTVIVNVPINTATGRWDVDRPPADWEQARPRWGFFRGVRS